MTTPETARTAARETPEWKATFIDLSDALPFLSGYHTNKLADAIYNAVNRRLPEPQASKASERCAFSPGVCNDPKCPVCGPLVASAHPPASEAEQPTPADAGSVSVRREDDEREALCEWLRHFARTYKGDVPLVSTLEAAAAALSASPTPPPAPARDAERPKCPECRDRGRVDVEDGRGNVVMDAACPRGCSAQPPSTGDIIDRAVAWVEEKYPMRGHATGELLRECIAEISTLRHAARVPLPQQQGEDRSWEKECEIHANGIVSYPSTALTTRSVYLVPDGRWLTYDQWLLLTPPSDRFPNERAAREALAKAPRPTP